MNYYSSYWMARDPGFQTRKNISRLKRSFPFEKILKIRFRSGQSAVRLARLVRAADWSELDLGGNVHKLRYQSVWKRCLKKESHSGWFRTLYCVGSGFLLCSQPRVPMKPRGMFSSDRDFLPLQSIPIDGNKKGCIHWSFLWSSAVNWGRILTARISLANRTSR